MEKDKCGIEFYLLKWPGDKGEYELYIHYPQPGEGKIVAYLSPRDMQPLRVVASGIVHFEGEEQKIAETLAGILNAPLLSKLLNTIVNRVLTQVLSTTKE